MSASLPRRVRGPELSGNPGAEESPLLLLPPRLVDRIVDLGLEVRI